MRERGNVLLIFRGERRYREPRQRHTLLMGINAKLLFFSTLYFLGGAFFLLLCNYTVCRFGEKMIIMTDKSEHWNSDEKRGGREQGKEEGWEG